MNFDLKRTVRNIKNGPYFVYALLAIQIILFLLMTLDGGSENSVTLVKYGAKFNPYIIYNQEWWRFITPVFLHIGFAHLLMNSLVLYFVGSQVESIFGHTRFIIIYLLSGIAGNAASFAFSGGISAGASTALFGLFGCYLMLVVVFPNDPRVRQSSRHFGLYVMLSLASSVFMPSIDIAGHIGGLIGGFLIAMMVSVPQKVDKIMDKRILSAVAYLLAVGILIYGGFLRG